MKRLKSTVQFLVIPLTITALFAYMLFVLVLPRMQNEILESKKETCRELTRSVWSLVADYEMREKSGELTHEDAQYRAVARIRDMRFGPEMKDYFWISDLQARMIMHPYRRELEGLDLSDYTDQANRHPFQKFAQIAKESGEGFVEYQWQWNDDKNLLEDKLSYVKLFKPWGWIVGAGVYVQDVKADVGIIYVRLAIICSTIFLGIVALNFYLSGKNLRLEKDRERANSDLEESEKSFRATLKNANDGILISIDQGVIVFANLQAAAIFGYTATELERMQLKDLVHPDEYEKVFEKFKSRLEGKQVQSHYEVSVLDKKGNRISLEASGARTIWQRQPASVLILRDISERKQKQRKSAHINAVLHSIRSVNQLAIQEKDIHGFIKEVCETLVRTGAYRTAWIALTDAELKIIDGVEVGLGDAFANILENLRSERPADSFRKMLTEPGPFVGEGSEMVFPTTNEPILASGCGILGIRIERGGKVYGLLCVSSAAEFVSETEAQALFLELAKDIAFMFNHAEQETKRKRAEEELKESEERFRVIFNTSKDFITITDRKGTIVWANPAWKTTLGVSEENCLGLHANIHPEDAERVAHAWNLMQLGENEITNLEYRHRTMDGSYIHLEATAKRIIIGREPYVYLMAHDITWRKQVEEGTRLREEAFRSLAENVPDIIARFNRELRYLYVNCEVESKTGIPAQVFLGRTHHEIGFSDELVKLLNGSLQEVFRTGRPSTIEFVYEGPPGTRSFETRLMPELGSDGTVQTVLGIYRDITEQKQAEYLMRVQRDLGLALNSAFTLEDALNQILCTALLIDTIDCGSIYLVDEVTGGLNIAVHGGLSDDYIEITGHINAEAPLAQLAMKGEAFYGNHQEANPATDEVRKREGLHSLAVVPVRHGGKNIAVLNLASHTSDVIPVKSRTAIESIASQIGSVITRVRAREALQRSENRYHSLVNGSPVGMFRTDANGHYTFVNEPWCKLAGLTQEEALGENWMRALHPEDRERIRSAWYQAVQSGIDFKSEYRFQRPDDTISWVLGQTEAETDLNGVVLGYVGTITDITERLLAEKALEEERDKAKHCLDIAGAMLVIIGADQCVSLINRKGCDILGYAESEILGKNWFNNFVPDTQRESVKKVFRELMAGKTELVENIENFVLTKDKQVKIMAWHYTAMHDTQGRIIATLGSGIDITDRKQAELELHRVNRTLKMMVDCDRALVSAKNEKELLQEICRIMVDSGQYRLVWVGYAEQDEYLTVTPVAQAGFEEGYLQTLIFSWADGPSGHGPTGSAIRNAQACVCRDILTDPNFGLWREAAIQRGYVSSAALPLLAEGRAIGALNVYAAESDAFESKELLLLTTLAKDLAHGILTLRARTTHLCTEESLYDERDFNQILIQSSPAYYVTLDVNLKVIMMNEALLKSLGYSQEEVAGIDYSYFIPEGERDMLKLMLKKLSSYSELTSMEDRIIAKDRHELLVAWHRKAVFKKDGALDFIFCMGIDITSQREVESQLETSEALLVAAIEQSAAGVIVAEAPDGDIRIANAAAAEMLGVGKRQIKEAWQNRYPISWQTFKPDGTPCRTEEGPLWRAIRHGEVVSGQELIIKGETQQRRIISTHASPVRNINGKIIAGVSVLMEVKAGEKDKAASPESQKPPEPGS